MASIRHIANVSVDTIASISERVTTLGDDVGRCCSVIVPMHCNHGLPTATPSTRVCSRRLQSRQGIRNVCPSFWRAAPPQKVRSRPSSRLVRVILLRVVSLSLSSSSDQNLPSSSRSIVVSIVKKIVIQQRPRVKQRQVNGKKTQQNKRNIKHNAKAERTRW
jgi:hypothetical protein